MNTPRILVIDENAEVAQLEHAMFEMHHYNVDVTVHAEEALRRLATRRYDVVVVGSPIVVDGRYMLDMIRESYASILSCTIVVTWKPDDAALLRRCRESRVYAVLAKPFDVEELSNVVAECIRNGCQPTETRWIGIPDQDALRKAKGEETP